MLSLFVSLGEIELESKWSTNLIFVKISLSLSSQPFFVLHKASSSKSEKISNGTGRTRRRIDLPPASPKKTDKSEAEKARERDEHRYDHLRKEAFELVCSKIDSIIKVCLITL